MTSSITLETYQSHSDDSLVELTLTGLDDAYEVLVNRHKKRVFAIARHFFRQSETVEDIAQETFSKAYFALNNYQRGASLEYWLARITVNNCYDELRRRRARGELTISDLSEDESGWIDNKLLQVSINKHYQINNKEAAAEITSKLLQHLDVEDRIVLILLHAEEYSIAEIARFLNWTEAKVKIRAFRARLALRKVLKRLNVIDQRKEQRTSALLTPR